MSQPNKTMGLRFHVITESDVSGMMLLPFDHNGYEKALLNGSDGVIRPVAPFTSQPLNVRMFLSHRTIAWFSVEVVRYDFDNSFQAASLRR